MHSQDYNDPHDYKDKNVLILGAGNSGVDIALEISSVGKKV